MEEERGVWYGMVWYGVVGYVVAMVVRGEQSYT